MPFTRTYYIQTTSKVLPIRPWSTNLSQISSLMNDSCHGNL